MITKRGKPVAKLVLLDTETGEIYNFLPGKGAVTGDIVSPTISPEEWGTQVILADTHDSREIDGLKMFRIVPGIRRLFW